MSDEQSGAYVPGTTKRSGIRPPAASESDRAATLRLAEFSAFYRSEVGNLAWFIMKIGATYHEATEAAQAAMAHAWAAWESIHSNRHAWVRTVAIREFYRQSPKSVDPRATVPDRPVLLSPDVVVEISERARAAQELLAELPTTQRHVMAWTADGYAIAEIAHATGSNEAAVRKNLQRARDALKRRLAEGRGGA